VPTVADVTSTPCSARMGSAVLAKDVVKNKDGDALHLVVVVGYCDGRAEAWVVGSFVLAVHLIYSDILSLSPDAIVISTLFLQSSSRDFSIVMSFYSTTLSLSLLPP
jgi:hypothetical protein